MSDNPLVRGWWGEPVGPGIRTWVTPGHGYTVVSEELNARIPACLKRRPVYFEHRNCGYYEEDVEWAGVAVTFPGLFAEEDVTLAWDRLQNWNPDAFEELTGQKLGPRQSHIRDDVELRAWLGLPAVEESGK